jgi:hypothetical protein
MADATTTPNPWINAGADLLGNYLTSQSTSAQQNALNQGLAQGANYIDTAYNKAAIQQQPYLNMGQQAMPEYMTRAQQVGSGMTMPQFQESPYYQVGMDAANRNAQDLRAKSSATGMYGSGNMANALQQNAQSTMLGAYDTANKDLFQRQQGGAAAMWNPVAQGASSAGNLGGLSMDAAKYQAGLAGQTGQANAAGAYTQNSLLNQAIKTGAGLLNPANFSALKGMFTQSPWEVANSPDNMFNADAQYIMDNPDQESLDYFNQIYGTNYSLQDFLGDQGTYSQGYDFAPSGGYNQDTGVYDYTQDPSYLAY